MLTFVLLYVVAGRVATYLLPEYRADLQSYLTNELGVQVEIDRISGTWSGFDPVLVINNISVNGARNAHLQSANIRFAFLKSVLEQSPRIKSIELDTANFKLLQRDDGVWNLAGFELSGLPASDSDGSADQLKSILNGANLLLVDAFVRVTTQSEGEQVWRLPSLSLSYLNSKIYASGNVIRPDGLQPLLRFVYNSDQIGDSSSVSGQLYVEARSSEFFDKFLEAYDWGGISIQEVDASGRLWIELDGLSVASVSADVQLHRLNWKINKKSLAPVLNSTIKLTWRGSEFGHRLDVHELALNWQNMSCERFFGTYEFGQDIHLISGSILDLECASSLLVALELAEGSLLERLEVGDPAGLMKNVSVEIVQSESGIESLKVTSELEGVSINAFEGAPSVSGVNGYLYSTLSDGYVMFDSPDFTLGFPELYLAKWAPDHAQGMVNWTVRDDDVQVFSQGLNLKMGPSSYIYGDFKLGLNDETDEDYLALMLGMQDIALPDVVRYVPFYEVTREVYDWLTVALQDGMVKEGAFFAYGSIEPNSPDNSFTTALSVTTSDASIQFDDAWPNAESLNANLALHDGKLGITAIDGLLANTKISTLSVALPEAQENEAISLKVSAAFDVDTPQLQYWLHDSPIAEDLSGLRETFEFEGMAKGQVDLAINLDEAVPPEYLLDLEFDSLTVRSEAQALTYDNVAGKVSISSEVGISSNTITGMLMDRPATLTLYTKPAVEKAEGALASYGQTVVTLVGQYDASRLVEDLGLSWDWGLSGVSDFKAEVFLSLLDSELAPELRFKSKMKGLTVDWPAPLNKLANQELDLSIKSVFENKQTSLDVRLAGRRYPLLDGKFLFVEDVFSYGKLRIVDAEPLELQAYTYTNDGLGLSIEADKLVLAPWLDFISANFAAGESENDFLNEVVVSTKKLDFYGEDLGAVDAIVAFSDQTVVSLNGERISGSVAIPKGDEAISVNLKNLQLNNTDSVAEPSSPSQQNASNVQAESPDPRNFPNVSVAIDNFGIGGKPYGAWSFWTIVDQYGLIVRDIVGQYSGSQVLGQLNWQFDEGQHQTILTLDGKGKNFEPLVTMFASQTPISSDNFTASVALVWPDSPQNFALKRLSGTIVLDLEDGQVKTGNNATGALRLFGIFNTDAIGRRLRLDFSDLYSSGISYDRFYVNASIDQGDLRFVEPMLIDGPSSNYEVRGDIDLDEQTLDLKLVVELPISSNVPLAGLMLGAPQIGGAVWLVDKVLGSPLSKLSTVRYAITGSWDDPQTNLEKVINAK
jgi:uncharacterized protein (TIGR02099 family)